MDTLQFDGRYQCWPAVSQVQKRMQAIDRRPCLPDGQSHDGVREQSDGFDVALAGDLDDHDQVDLQRHLIWKSERGEKYTSNLAVRSIAALSCLNVQNERAKCSRSMVDSCSLIRIFWCNNNMSDGVMSVPSTSVVVVNFWETTLASVIAGLVTAVVVAGVGALKAYIGNRHANRAPSERQDSGSDDHSINISGRVGRDVIAKTIDNRSYTNLEIRNNYRNSNSNESEDEIGNAFAFLAAAFLGLLVTAVLFVLVSQYVMLAGSILVGFAFGWSAVLFSRECLMRRKLSMVSSFAFVRAVAATIGFILIWNQIRSASLSSLSLSEIRDQLGSIGTGSGVVPRFIDQVTLFGDIHGAEGVQFIIGLLLAAVCAIVCGLMVVLDCFFQANYLRLYSGFPLSEKRAKYALNYGERNLIGNIFLTIGIIAFGAMGIYLGSGNLANLLGKLG